MFSLLTIFRVFEAAAQRVSLCSHSLRIHFRRTERRPPESGLVSDGNDSFEHEADAVIGAIQNLTKL
jgi:hypothetical protein